MIHDGSPRCGMPACPACRQELERAIRADERAKIRRAVKRLSRAPCGVAAPAVFIVDVEAILRRRDERARKEAGR